MKVFEKVFNLMAAISLMWVFFLFFAGATMIGYWIINVAALLIVAAAMMFSYSNKSNS